MGLNSWDNQTDKKITTPRVKDKTSKGKQESKAKKLSDKPRKKKKKKIFWEKCNKREGSISAIEINVKASKWKDTGQIIYYNCTKKGHIFRDYIKLKKAKN